MGKAGHAIAQDICFFSIALSYNCTMVKGFIYLLLVNQLRAVIGGKISRWLEFLMHDYMTVRRKESRCPSIKHLYTKKNLKRLDDNIFS